MEDLTFEIEDKNGKINKYELLLSFTENNKNYIVYTDALTDDDENKNEKLNIYASTYDIKDNKYVIDDINEEDYDLVNKKMLDFISEE